MKLLERGECETTGVLADPTEACRECGLAGQHKLDCGIGRVPRRKDAMTTEQEIEAALAGVEDAGERLCARWTILFGVGGDVAKAHRIWSGLSESSREPWRTLAAALRAEAIAECVAEAERVTFAEAWAAKEAEGYQYGDDALEQVRFGWEIRQAKVLAALRALAAKGQR